MGTEQHNRFVELAIFQVDRDGTAYVGQIKVTGDPRTDKADTPRIKRSSDALKQEIAQMRRWHRPEASA